MLTTIFILSLVCSLLFYLDRRFRNLGLHLWFLGNRCNKNFSGGFLLILAREMRVYVWRVCLGLTLVGLFISTILILRLRWILADWFGGGASRDREAGGSHRWAWVWGCFSIQFGFSLLCNFGIIGIVFLLVMGLNFLVLLFI